MHVIPLFAHGRPLLFVFYGVILVVGVGALAGLGVIAHLFLRDAIRLGRARIPWLWIALIAACISVVAFYLAGPWGVSAGMPLLLFFGLGRFLARKHATKT
jgi:hypothetical protein